jgi:L-rhamnose-H+ transport protein
MTAFLGILAAVISGTLNGSFAVPAKFNVKWEWENSWLLYTLSAMVIFPVIISFLTIPGLVGIYDSVPGGVLLRTFLLGFGWGIGSVTFGLGLHMVGLSVGYTVIMGLIAVTGSLVPLLVHDPKGVFTSGGVLILLAMLLTVAGVALCGTAGAARDKAPQTPGRESDARRRFKTGFLVCITSGVLSAMLNLAFDFGSPIAAAVKNSLGPSASSLVANNAIWLLTLLGGAIPNASYCLYLLLRNKSWEKYGDTGTGLNWFRGVLMGAIWIGCIMSYGAGASNLGKLGAAVGWLILMATTVLVGNVWGIVTGEWKGSSPKVRRLMVQGLLLLIGSVVLVSLKNLLS